MVVVELVGSSAHYNVPLVSPFAYSTKRVG